MISKFTMDGAAEYYLGGVSPKFEETSTPCCINYLVTLTALLIDLFHL